MATYKKGRSTPFKVVAGASDERGKWRVICRGQVRTVTTSKTSMRAMKEAVRTYGPALSRLANR